MSRRTAVEHLVCNGQSLTLVDDDRIYYVGDKAEERFKLLRDLDNAGYSTPRFYYENDVLEVERVPGYSLSVLRRYGFKNNPEECAKLFQFAKSCGEGSMIVHGLRSHHLIYDGEQWFVVGGRCAEGVTKKRAKKFWKDVCHF